MLLIPSYCCCFFNFLIHVSAPPQCVIVPVQHFLLFKKSKRHQFAVLITLIFSEIRKQGSLCAKRSHLLSSALSSEGQFSWKHYKYLCHHTAEKPVSSAAWFNFAHSAILRQRRSRQGVLSKSGGCTISFGNTIERHLHGLWGEGNLIFQAG